MENRQLLNNHICFLKQNRGEIQTEDINIKLSCEFDNFDITFLIREQQSSFRSKFIYIPEWANSLKQNIKSGQLEKVSDLTYMSGNSNIVNVWNVNEAIETKKVISNSDLEIFSEVQSRGFCETKETYDEWFPFLRKKNFEGSLFNNQHFFIAYISNIAVGCCLIIDSDNTFGIYAVATLPEYRKKGIATSIMKSALEYCLNIKKQNFTLQTIKNSNAEKLYLHLGFKKEFNCEITKNINPS